MNKFSRVIALIGEDKLNALKNSNVLVVGVGGVGGVACEALVRSGIGKITIIDNDVVSETNINRQIIANTKTIGLKKVDIMRDRLLDINPDCSITALSMYYNIDTQIDFSCFDYVIDCIDSMKSKVHLVKTCLDNKINIISSMGTGNKLDPRKLEISKLSKTSYCPLAKILRKELKGYDYKVVYSTEQSKKIIVDEVYSPASMMMVPASAGLLLVSEVILDLLKGVE